MVRLDKVLYTAKVHTTEGSSLKAMNSIPQVRILPEDCNIELRESETVLSAAMRQGVHLTSVCGGNARCSTCRVSVESGLENCKPRTVKELAMAERLALTPTLRLACQLQLQGNATIRCLACDDRDTEAMLMTADLNSTSMVGQEKCVAILFSDIRGFTALSEKLPPFDVIHLLNRYFNYMGRIVERNGGCVNNYIGDGLMALFGIEDPSDAPLRAVKAGLEMFDALVDFNAYTQRLYELRIEIGIGIHWGDAVVGSIGSRNNQRTTAIGDAVNFAARIESATKETSTRLLISKATFDAIEEKVVSSQKLDVYLKGKTGTHVLYEIIGLQCPLVGLLPKN